MPNVLVSGPSVSSDKRLIDLLKKSARVGLNRDNAELIPLVQTNNFDAIILEIQTGDEALVQLGIEQIKEIKNVHTMIKVVVVHKNGERKVFGQAFKFGANDAFRKPYKVPLLVERLFALLDESSK